MTVIRVPYAVWDDFGSLAVGQLHRNLRRNGLKRRYLPTEQSIMSLLRLGVAIRVVDEMASEAPMSAAELDTR